MTAPPTADLDAYAGDTWAQTFRFLESGVPIDLTGATAVAQAREPTGAVHALAATIGPDEGEVTIGFADDPLPFLSWDHYRYDVEVTDADGAVRTWIKGRLRVLRDVTNETPPPEPPVETWVEEFTDLDAWTPSSGNVGGSQAATGGQWRASLNSPSDYLQINSVDTFDATLGWEAVVEMTPLMAFAAVGLIVSSDPDAIVNPQLFVEEQGDGSVIVHGGSSHLPFAETPTHLRIRHAGAAWGLSASFDDEATWEAIGTVDIAETGDLKLGLYAYGLAGMADPTIVAVETVTVTP